LIQPSPVLRHLTSRGNARIQVYSAEGEPLDAWRTRATIPRIPGPSPTSGRSPWPSMSLTEKVDISVPSLPRRASARTRRLSSLEIGVLATVRDAYEVQSVVKFRVDVGRPNSP
jgi:hypothetical protein